MFYVLEINNVNHFAIRSLDGLRQSHDVSLTLALSVTCLLSRLYRFDEIISAMILQESSNVKNVIKSLLFARG